MEQPFHLSLGVKSLKEESDFFENVLGAKILNKDYSKGVNIDAFGCQLYLEECENLKPDFPRFHFGFNFSMDDFDVIVQRMEKHQEFVTMKPKVVDAGLSTERTKMYLKSPTGYMIEIKGYR